MSKLPSDTSKLPNLRRGTSSLLNDGDEKVEKTSGKLKLLLPLLI